MTDFEMSGWAGEWRPLTLNGVGLRPMDWRRMLLIF
jgi:hypothetical protein